MSIDFSMCDTESNINQQIQTQSNQSVKVIEMTTNINQEMNIIITRDGRDWKSEYSRNSKIGDDLLIVS